MSDAATLGAAAALLAGSCRREAPLGARTTYRVGGPAALLAEVAGEEDLARVVKAVAETGVELLVLGRGSNVLVADAGFAGLCVVLAGSFARCELDEAAAVATAGGGLDLPVLARRTAASGLAGMEWAVGVPGSVGGAVRMNAGGHGSEVRQRLVSCRVVDLASGRDGERRLAELGLGYRRSSLSPSELVCSARFALEPGEARASARRIAEVVAWRRANQPGGRNAGSVFSNPPGDAAGRLVEAAGLKGMRLGSAEVSTKHANFVQADAGGSADDVLRLVQEVRRLVAERCGVELELELRPVGAFG